ncbi:hypothetical protein ACT3TE_18595 [Brachybacterium sp. AOP42-B2-9]|uniref:hypothetical protein n=1 Tax=Brachybacterium sp. AOP42-B2-9 TaxID=3457672 RepID=UPI004034C3D7
MTPTAQHQGPLERKILRIVAIPVSLIAIFVICAFVLISAELSAIGTIVAQTISAVSGAALGNYLRLDHERNSVRDHARVSVRQLFDQAARMGNAIKALETRRNLLQQAPAVSEDRIADWLDTAANDLRNEINATAQAIENWGDLAPDVRQSELKKHVDRPVRMPPTTSDKA